jgi:hypothetical protein
MERCDWRCLFSEGVQCHLAVGKYRDRLVFHFGIFYVFRCA